MSASCGGEVDDLRGAALQALERRLGSELLLQAHGVEGGGADGGL